MPGGAHRAHDAVDVAASKAHAVMLPWLKQRPRRIVTASRAPTVVELVIGAGAEHYGLVMESDGSLRWPLEAAGKPELSVASVGHWLCQRWPLEAGKPDLGVAGTKHWLCQRWLLEAAGKPDLGVAVAGHWQCLRWPLEAGKPELGGGQPSCCPTAVSHWAEAGST